MFKGDLIYLKSNHFDMNGFVQLYKHIRYEVVDIRDNSIILFCWNSGNVTVPKFKVDITKTRNKKIDILISEQDIV